MDVILILVGFIVFVFGTIRSLIAYFKKDKPASNKFAYIGLAGIAVFIVGMVILSRDLPDTPKTAISEEVEQVEQTKQFDNVYEEKAYSVWAEELDNVEVDEFEDGTIITVHAQINDLMSMNLTRKGFLKKVLEYMELMKSEDIDNLTVLGYFDLVDQYNNTYNDRVMEIAFTKETIDKFNYEDAGTYDLDKLPGLAEFYSAHPGLQ